MISAKKVLERIESDYRLNPAHFQVAYYDSKAEDHEFRSRVQFADIIEMRETSFTRWVGDFETIIPYSRIREVYHNGTRIWRRVVPTDK